MDWLKLFALLVAVASFPITADGTKKKIRIHLPQKVKHIHHHKKIYITNHPAPSQYAPAYLPGVKGAVALPSNEPRPAVAGLVPLNSVEYYDERTRLPGVSPAASKLLPLYRARGHYGPNHSEWDEQEYDLEPPPESSNVYAPSGYAAPPVPASPPSNLKRVKLVKLGETPRKKVLRKLKPTRVMVRGRPQPPSALTEEEHPVSTFHEQFYSDLEEVGTISKYRKPPRIEKIIEGDTEHIHTYSEEHIHKVVFDDDSKMNGVDPAASMSALRAAQPLIPLKNAQTLVAIPTNNFNDYSVVGSMGTPSHMEYASYNPQDVTHDHIFHDHGEIPANVEVTKDALRRPPKMSYNSHGLPIQVPKRHPSKQTRLYSKPMKPSQDFSYYENFYNAPKAYNTLPKRIPRPTNPTPLYDITSESNNNDFRPIQPPRFKESKKKHKSRHYGKHNTPSYGQQQAPVPFTMSSTVVHDYEPKNYNNIGTTTGISKYRDPLVDFKDSYGSDFDYEGFASSNVHTSMSEDKYDYGSVQNRSPKSVSTQNISFGGQDHQTFVDHIGDSSNPVISISEEAPTAMELHSFEQTTEVTPTPYTIRETSPAHPYYTAMALKALHGEQPQASNDNVQYGDAPATEAATEPTIATNSSEPLRYYKIQSTDAVTPDPEFIALTKSKRRRAKNKHQHSHGYLVAEYGSEESSTLAGHSVRHHYNKNPYATDSGVRSNLKYGDKI